MHRSDALPWQSVVRDALVEAGVAPENGFTVEHAVGTKLSGSTFDGMGRRHGAVELLNRGDFGKLRVAVRASVERILFSHRISGTVFFVLFHLKVQLYILVYYVSLEDFYLYN